MPIFLPAMAGLAGFLMSNPHRAKRRRAKKPRRVKSAKGTWKTVTTITKTVKRQKVNPQEYWWYPYTREELHYPWVRGHGAILSATKPHPDKPGSRWRRDKRTERTRGLPDRAAIDRDIESHGIGAALRSNPRQVTANEVKQLGLLQQEAAIAKSKYENRRQSHGPEARRLKEEMVRARLRHRNFWWAVVGHDFWTRKNPSTPLTDSSRLISHGHYFVSDKEAGQLAKAVDRRLPGHGRELRVATPDGKLWWLNRTPVAHDPRFQTKRGWVWCIY